MIKHPRIACVGAGYWGRNLVRNFHDLGVLGWICELDPKRREQLSVEYPGVPTTACLDEVLSDAGVAGIAIADIGPVSR